MTERYGGRETEVEGGAERERDREGGGDIVVVVIRNKVGCF